MRYGTSFGSWNIGGITKNKNVFILARAECIFISRNETKIISHFASFNYIATHIYGDNNKNIKRNFLLIIRNNLLFIIIDSFNLKLRNYLYIFIYLNITHSFRAS